MNNKKQYKIMGFNVSGNKVVSYTKEAPLTDISDNEYADSSDSILMTASVLVDNIIDDVLYIDRLTPYHMDLLAYYFYKTRTYVGRSIRMKSRIPLSALNITRPDVENQIVQEAVHKWYEKTLNKIKFKNTIYKVLVSMNLYGRGYVIIQTDSSYGSSTYNNIDNLTNEISKEDNEKIKSITERYSENFSSVTKEEVDFVIKKLMPVVNDFNGIKVARAVDVMEISEERENEDINYYEIDIQVSDNIKNYYNLYIKENGSITDKNDIKKGFVSYMAELGYSKSYVSLCYDSVSIGEDTITISSDYEEDCFIVKFEDEDIGNRFTPLISVMKDLIDMEIRKRKNKKVDIVADKNVKILSSINASPEELEMLISDVQDSVQNADFSALVTNYDIDITELDFSIKDPNTTEGEDPKDDILAGLGMPQSIFDASESYGSGFIQIQTLNTELQSIANSFEYQIKNSLFHILSYKKGFIMMDKHLINDIKHISLSLFNKNFFSSCMFILDFDKS